MSKYVDKQISTLNATVNAEASLSSPGAERDGARGSDARKGTAHRSAARHNISRRKFLYFTGYGAAMAALANPISAFADNEAVDADATEANTAETDAQELDDAAAQSADEPRSEIWGHFFYDEEKKSTATVVRGQIQEDFYFNENFFENSSFYFNPHLCSLACSMALASFPSNEQSYADKSSNAAKLFAELDCNAAVFVANEDYKKQPEKDTIGLVCSYRTITVDGEPCNLVFLSVRGAVYQLEWCSNLKAGATYAVRNQNHQGFTEAADKAIEFLKACIKSFELEGPTKIFMSGFSRAAATINLTAGYINEDAIAKTTDWDDDKGYNLSSILGDQIDIYQGDLYAFCFEAPAGLHADTSTARTAAVDNHRNIFNIINPCDLVPLVMPSQFQFMRYGVDVKMAAPTDGVRWVRAQQKMIACANKVGELFDPTLVDTFSNVKYFSRWVSITELPKRPNPQNMFLVEFFDALTSQPYINSRTKYQTNFQETFRKTYEVIDTMRSEAGFSKFTQYVTSQFGDIATALKLYALLEAQITGDIYNFFIRVVGDGLKDADNKCPGSTMYKKYNNVLCLLIYSLINDECVAFLKQYLIKIIVFATKGSDIFTCHKPGMALAWAHAMDSNFITGTSPFRPTFSADDVDYAPEPESEYSVNAMALATVDIEGDSSEDDIVAYSDSANDGDTRYRSLTLTGTKLNVWAVVDGQEYQIFKDGAAVDSGTYLPLAYNIDFDLQKSIWLDGSSEQKFRVEIPEGTDLRCVASRLDYTQTEPVAVYVFDNMPEIFPESVNYEITFYADQLWVHEEYSEDQSNDTFLSGNYYHEDESDSGDKTMYYTISTAAEPASAAAVCGGGYTKRGTRSLVFAPTSKNYEFDYWTLDGERVASDDVYTEMSTFITDDNVSIDVPLYQVLVDADHEVVVHYKKKSESGSGDADGSGDDSGESKGDQGNGGSGSGDGTGDSSSNSGNGGSELGTDDGSGSSTDNTSNNSSASGKKTSSDPLPQTGDLFDSAAKLTAGAAAVVGAAAVASNMVSAEADTEDASKD